MITKTIGKRIREVRTIRSMTQFDLGLVIGKDRSVVAKYEAGDIDIPITVLNDIARALKVKVGDLVKNGKSI